MEWVGSQENLLIIRTLGEKWQEILLTHQNERLSRQSRKIWHGAIIGKTKKEKSSDMS